MAAPNFADKTNVLRRTQAVKITETEIPDMDGTVRRVRTIEAAHARLERADGTIEEYSDCTAKEWPWSREGSPREWRLHGIPVTVLPMFQRGLGKAAIKSISLLSESSEVIIKLAEITMGTLLSETGEDFLSGKEVPPERE